MTRFVNKDGFSLAETLIALGILAVGMLLVAGVFPVAIQFITTSAEQTTAAVVAEEAFAKVQLYGSKAGINYANLQTNSLTDFNDINIIFNIPTPDIGKYEFIYPSTNSSNAGISHKQYCWSAMCRLTRPYNPAEPNYPVQVTVFVCRKAGRSSTFHRRVGGTGNWPEPIDITVTGSGTIVQITKQDYVSNDSTIVDDQSGQIYRVIKRLPAPDDNRIQLDRQWTGGSKAWVIPPAIGGSRNPCIAVYQKEILF